VLLGLGDGPLRFFKNDVQHGPGYAAGSVTGPVVAAVHMYNENASARLHKSRPLFVPVPHCRRPRRPPFALGPQWPSFSIKRRGRGGGAWGLLGAAIGPLG
jgi:hypothetical protein